MGDNVDGAVTPSLTLFAWLNLMQSPGRNYYLQASKRRPRAVRSFVNDTVIRDSDLDLK